MDHLEIVYGINQRIKALQEKIEKLRQKSSQKGKGIDADAERSIGDLNIKINELILERTRELKRVRWSEKRKPRVKPTSKPADKIDSATVPEAVNTDRTPTPIPVAIQSVLVPSTLKVSDMDVGTDSTTLTMVPTWFQTDSKEDALDGIVYPEGAGDREQFVTVARFRAVRGQSKDFTLHPIDISEKSTETLILSLDAFARQFGGQLSFTNRDLTFENSAENAACGVPNLGSAHLLANDGVPTANFSFIVELDYETELAFSEQTLETFIINFTVAIAQVLGCKKDYVRVFSIEKVDGQPGLVRVNFGLTTANQEDTESLAIQLQDKAKKGFGDNEVLQVVQLGDYDYKWKSVLSYLELRVSDFDPRFNFDYAQPDLPYEQERGSYPYFLPLGWYRHALNVSQKYSDGTVWLDHKNSAGEWPVAFHGTHLGAVGNITRHGLSTDGVKRDLMLEEAVQQIGPSMNKPGLYLATHCNGGSDAYATTFPVQNGNITEIFQIVFQCRVKPDSFTVHTCCIVEGHGWRVVDPTAVRPYGLLLRKIET
ncbi:unnamed protein product [Adineta ricciae]|uniref:Uncharacterized protein n=1 Tax=Adineta ricciae TaxID=249248 RepID=A0A814EKE9_ADIRI|nr:unnamed protein product [Adineta ricciae]